MAKNNSFSVADWGGSHKMVTCNNCNKYELISNRKPKGAVKQWATSHDCNAEPDPIRKDIDG